MSKVTPSRPIEPDEVVFGTDHYAVLIVSSDSADADRCVYTDGWGRYQEAYAVVNRATGVIEHLTPKFPEAAMTAVGLSRVMLQAPWDAVETEPAPQGPELFGPLN